MNKQERIELKVGDIVLILSGGFQGQKGKITEVGAEHNHIGCYLYVERPDGIEERYIYPEDIEILI